MVREDFGRTRDIVAPEQSLLPPMNHIDEVSPHLVGKIVQAVEMMEGVRIKDKVVDVENDGDVVLPHGLDDRADRIGHTHSEDHEDVRIENEFKLRKVCFAKDATLDPL